MFGKLMSISDQLMWRYIDLLSFSSQTEQKKWKDEHPRDVKVRFAKEIVARFHSQQAAAAAEADFDSRFRKGETPEDMPEVALQAGAEGMLITQALKQANLVPSTTEAQRTIEQGGVKIDGEKVSDRGLRLKAGCNVVIQVGKRKFARVRLT
jgi:tyrosyl-tRNA synthetase